MQIAMVFRMRTVTYTRNAQKQLQSIGAVDARRIIAKLKQYAADPVSLANQVKALKGADAFRLRVGDYRVIFTEDAVVLLILKVGHRREIYE
jgi:mRNA interferase RelE/StbE